MSESSGSQPSSGNVKEYEIVLRVKVDLNRFDQPSRWDWDTLIGPESEEAVQIVSEKEIA